MQKKYVGYPLSTLLVLLMAIATCIFVGGVMTGIGMHIIASNQSRLLVQVAGVILVYGGMRILVLIIGYGTRTFL